MSVYLEMVLWVRRFCCCCWDVVEEYFGLCWGVMCWLYWILVVVIDVFIWKCNSLDGGLGCCGGEIRVGRFFWWVLVCKGRGGIGMYGGGLMRVWFSVVFVVVCLGWILFVVVIDFGDGNVLLWRKYVLKFDWERVEVYFIWFIFFY